MRLTLKFTTKKGLKVAISTCDSIYSFNFLLKKWEDVLWLYGVRHNKSKNLVCSCGEPKFFPINLARELGGEKVKKCSVCQVPELVTDIEEIVCDLDRLESNHTSYVKGYNKFVNSVVSLSVSVRDCECWLKRTITETNIEFVDLILFTLFQKCKSVLYCDNCNIPRKLQLSQVIDSKDPGSDLVKIKNMIWSRTLFNEGKNIFKPFIERWDETIGWASNLD